MSLVLANAVVRIGADIGNLEAGLALATEATAKAGKEIGQIGKSISLYVTAPLVALGALAIHEFGTQEDALVRLGAVVKATGGEAGITAGHVEDLAVALQKTTIYADDATEAAAAILLTFKGVRNEVGAGNQIFDRAVIASQDLAAVMGTDLQDAMRKLGVALEDPEAGLTLLRRTGVIFTDEEKAQIKTLYEHGHVLEAQAMILDKIEGKFKGVAAAMAATPLGRLKQAWNAVGDALETVGAILAPVIIGLSNAVKTAAGAFEKMDPGIKQTLVTIAALAASIGPLLVAFSMAQKAVTAFSTVAMLSKIAIGALALTIGLIITTIGVWAVVIQELADNWTRIGLKLQLVWQGMQMVWLAVWTKIKMIVFTVIAAILNELSNIPFIGKFFAEARDRVVAAMADMNRNASKELLALGLQVAKTEQELAADLLAAGDDAENAGTRIHHGLNKPKPPQWVKEVAPIMAEFNAAMAVSARMADLMGPSYDQAGAQADILNTALEKLAATTVPLEAHLGNTGKSARDLAEDLQFRQLESTTIKSYNDALTKLNSDTAAAVLQHQALGDSFDLAGSEADALEGFLASLGAAGIDLSGALGPTGETVDEMRVRIAALRAESEAAVAAHERFNAQMQLARSAVEAAQTPLQTYNETVMALSEAFMRGKINLTEFYAAAAQAKVTLDEAAQKSDELRQGIVDLTGRAVDNFVDMAIEGKKSFSDFVESALKDLAKLILKLTLMNLLFGKGGPLESLGKSAGRFARGGFLGPGELGIVGETGPELIAGGRSGMSIAPLGGARHMGGESLGIGSDNVGVTVNVNAVDAAGVARFFEENEGLVAHSMLRAYQRSRALRGVLGGG